MENKPGIEYRLRRVSQTLIVAMVVIVLIVGAASAQWGGWWGGGSSGGGWWGNQSSGRSHRQQRRAVRRYAPGQAYQPQQQYNPFYPSARQPTAQYPRATTTTPRHRARRKPPVVAYGRDDDQETRRSRASKSGTSIRTRSRRGDRNPDPGDQGRQARSGSYGTTYCVRLCDGRFFPLADPGHMKAEDMCSALCPATSTKVFSGGTIDDAAATDGARYQKLKNAFLFRKEMVQGCTCNGKTPYGLAKLDLKSDPTLQTGDIVVMTDGLSVYGKRWERRRGRRGRRYYKATGRFTPIKKSSLVSRSFRRKLNRIEIAKTRPRLHQARQNQQNEPVQPDLTD